jgi:hypothetical protein
MILPAGRFTVYHHTSQFIAEGLFQKGWQSLFRHLSLQCQALELSKERAKVLIGLLETEQIITGIMDSVGVPKGTVQYVQDTVVVIELADPLVDIR